MSDMGVGERVTLDGAVALGVAWVEVHLPRCPRSSGGMAAL